MFVVYVYNKFVVPVLYIVLFIYPVLCLLFICLFVVYFVVFICDHSCTYMYCKVLPIAPGARMWS